jgi:hypothetical protein
MKTNKKMLLAALTIFAAVFSAQAMERKEEIKEEWNITKEWQDCRFKTITFDFPKTKCSECDQIITNFIGYHYFGMDATNTCIILEGIPEHTKRSFIKKHTTTCETALTKRIGVRVGAYNTITNKISPEQCFAPILRLQGDYSLTCIVMNQKKYPPFSLSGIFNARAENGKSILFKKHQIDKNASIDNYESIEENLNMEFYTGSSRDCSSRMPTNNIIAITMKQSKTKENLVLFGTDPFKPLCTLMENPMHVFVNAEGTMVCNYEFFNGQAKVTIFKLLDKTPGTKTTMPYKDMHFNFK